MKPHKTKHAQKAGLPPGSLTHVEAPKSQETKIRIITYNENSFQEADTPDWKHITQHQSPDTKIWIRISGLHDISLVETVGRHFGLDDLILEDILNTRHPPKMEDLEDSLFIITKSMSLCHDNEILCEQFAIILFPQIVITFEEQDLAELNLIHERIKSGKIRIRKMGTDYLVYSIIDAIVDQYFYLLDAVESRIDILEEEERQSTSSDFFEELLRLKRQLIELRKTVWPMREVVAGLQNENNLVQETTIRYIKDVYDHTIQIIDTIESFRDMLAGLMDVHLSIINNRMNETMKRLTLIATIFMPLTFIAGIYGMNFEYMPELQWKWGYPAVMSFMLLVSVVMVLYFRIKEWL